MKKFVSTFLVLVMFLSVPVLAVDGNLTEDTREADLARATNVLLQSGWTQEQIDDFLTEDALLVYKDAMPVAFETKYYKVSEDGMIEMPEEECLAEVEMINELKSKDGNEISLLSGIPEGSVKNDTVTTDDGYMEYYVSAFNIGNNQYVLSARYEWLIAPYNRKEDVFGLGHDSHLTQVGTHSDVNYVYKADVTTIIGSTTNTYTYETTAPTTMVVDDGGTVVVQKLFSDASGVGMDMVTSRNHRGFIQYTVKVNSSTARMVSVYAEYLHQEAVIGVSPSVSFPAGGSISVSSESKFKRMSQNPYLAFDV